MIEDYKEAYQDTFTELRSKDFTKPTAIVYSLLDAFPTRDQSKICNKLLAILEGAVVSPLMLPTLPWITYDTVKLLLKSKTNE